MTRDPHPRWRSLLFVPAHVERFTARAGERGADAVILDLEDSVPHDAKRAARGALPAAVAAVVRGARAMVRVNHGLRHLAADLDAAVIPGVDALVLPKVESAAWVREIADAVTELELERRLPAGAIRFVLQIETPGALPDLAQIAAAHRRVAAMTLGPEDFCAALGAVPTPDVLLGPNLAVLCAACAAGVTPLGFVGSIGAYDDPAAYRVTASQARRMGFRGAMAIHPAQVAILNDAFTPTAEEVDWARRVLEAEREAGAQGRSAFKVDGRMVDPPVVARARGMLAAAPQSQEAGIAREADATPHTDAQGP